MRKHVRLLLFMCVMALFAAPGWATDVGTFAQLQTALSDPSVSEITLTANIDMTAAAIDIRRAMTINGAGYTLKQTTSGQRHFSIQLLRNGDTVTIKNLTIDGNSTQGGVTVTGNYSKVNFDNVTFTNNAGVGALRLDNRSAVTLNDMAFKNNEGTGSNGSAVHIIGNATANFTGTAVFKNNPRSIYVRQANNLTLSPGTQFTSDTETTFILTDGNTGGYELKIPENTRFTINSPKTDMTDGLINTDGNVLLSSGTCLTGGAYAVVATGIVTTTDVVFQSVSPAPSEGHSPCGVKCGTGVFTNCLFMNFFQGVTCTGNSTFTNCLFANDGTDPASKNNSAYSVLTGSIIATDTTFQGTTHAVKLNSSSNNEITRCAFIGNSTSSGSGAAITYLSGTINKPSITVRDSFFNNNTGQQGGAIGIGQGASLSLYRCTFSENSSKGSGGALNSYGSTHIVDCTFHDNHSDWQGGAIYITGYKTTATTTTSSELFFNTFVNNGAATQGGGLYADFTLSNSEHSSLHMMGNILVGNTGTSGGDVYFASKKYTYSYGGSTLSSNTALHSLGGNIIGTFCGQLLPSGSPITKWRPVSGSDSFVYGDFDYDSQDESINTSTSIFGTAAPALAQNGSQIYAGTTLKDIYGNADYRYPLMTVMPSPSALARDFITTADADGKFKTYFSGFDFTDARGVSRPQGEKVDSGAVEGTETDAKNVVWPLERVEISGNATRTLTLGSTFPLTAIAYGTNGGPITTGVTFNWTSGASGGIVSPADPTQPTTTFTAQSTGTDTVTVTATQGSIVKSADIQVTVTSGTGTETVLNSVAIDGTLSVAEGGTTTLTAKAKNSGGTEIAGSGVGFTWTITSGSGTVATISGLNNTATVTISGVAAGTATIQVTATQGSVSKVTSKDITVTSGGTGTETVLNSVAIDGTLSVAEGGTTTLTAKAKNSGGTEIAGSGVGFTWTITSGSGTVATISGLNNTATVTISGVAAGTATIQVTATQGSVSKVTSKDITVTSGGTGPSSTEPSIPDGPLPTGTQNAAYNGGTGFVFTVTGNPFTSLVVSGLPSGMNATANNTTGVVTINGTPTESGNFTVTVTATNAAGMATKGLPLNISASSSSTPTAPVIPDVTLPGGTQGTPYYGSGAYTLTVTGVPFSTLAASGLPSGMNAITNNATGTVAISGTPTMSGSFNITVTAANTGGTATRGLQLTITPSGSSTPAAPVIPNVTLPNGTQGTAYNSGTDYLFAVAGAPFTTLTVSGLPGGMNAITNYATGAIAISGTPMANGNFTATVTAANAGGTATKGLLLTVNASGMSTSSVPSIPPVTLPIGTQGMAYNNNNDFAFTVSGIPLTELTVTGLPGGMNSTTDKTTGRVIIYGTPMESGNFTVTVTAGNAVGTATKGLSLTVNASGTSMSSVPSIPPVTLPIGTQDMAYNNNNVFAFTVSGIPLTELTVTGLPGGMNSTADKTTGYITISGTPTESGSFTVTVTAANVAGTATKGLALTIKDIVTASPTITTNVLPDAMAGIPYSNKLAASGGGITWKLRSGSSLPAGLSLSSDGTVSGTPTTAGWYTFSVEAGNTLGSDVSTVNLFVAPNPSAPVPAAPVITTEILDKGTVGVAYSATLTATGTPPITWAISKGDLPAGLSLDVSGGVISGTPTTVGAQNFTVKATNSLGMNRKDLAIVVLGKNSEGTTTPKNDKSGGGGGGGCDAGFGALAVAALGAALPRLRRK